MKHLKYFEAIKYYPLDLITYVVKKDLEKVKEILNTNIDLNITTILGDTASHEAVYYNLYDILKLLIESGSNINKKNVDGYTPLIMASNYMFCDIIDLLIESGADWNIKDNDGYDFLDYLNKKHFCYIVDKYESEYDNYLILKNTEKYNL